MKSSDEHRQKMRGLQAEQRAKVLANTTSRGVVVVHTGDGKGKSTAAFGIALRAAGCGQRVAIVQFIKGTWKTGEQAAFKRFAEITHVVSGDGFTWNTQDRDKDVESAERGWATARAMIDSGDFDVVILDELNIALGHGYLDANEVARVLRGKPDEVSVIVTGRGAPASVIEAADTVTEHKLVKHAFQSGIRARRGIEF